MMGLAPKPPGFNAFGQDYWIGNGVVTVPAIPALGQRSSCVPAELCPPHR